MMMKIKLWESKKKRTRNNTVNLITSQTTMGKHISPEVRKTSAGTIKNRKGKIDKK